MNGSKHFDPQLGVDFHTYIVPPCGGVINIT